MSELIHSALCFWGYVFIPSIQLYVLYKFIDYLIRLPRMRKYKGRNIMITGCDTGFGFEAAKRLDALGCHVIATCFTEAGESILGKQCSERLCTLHMDISKPKSVRKGYEIVKSKLSEDKGLWALVNNAAIGGRMGPLDWLSLDDYRHCLDVNLYGTIDVTTTFLPLIRQERGRVVVVSSILGRTAFSNCVPYCMSKHALEVFADVLRRELRVWRCSVHLIEPGFYRTSLMKAETLGGNVEQVWNRLSPEMKRIYGEDFYVKLYNNLTDVTRIQRLVSKRVDRVVDVYEQAAIGMWPRARYTVGGHAKMLLFLHWLPEWLTDSAMRLISHRDLTPDQCVRNREAAREAKQRKKEE